MAVNAIVTLRKLIHSRQTTTMDFHRSQSSVPKFSEELETAIEHQGLAALLKLSRKESICLGMYLSNMNLICL